MSKAVQDMFARISPRYDLANDVISLGIHRLWRKSVKAKVKPAKDEVIVDICTGTGDLANELFKGSKALVIGIDFVGSMLRRAKVKYPKSPVIQGDAMLLPLRDGCADAVSMAFGIRNLDNPGVGLAEIKRVLKKNGRVAILEFGQPNNSFFSSIYTLYSKVVIPRLGALLTGDREAYEYLPETSARFPCREEFLRLMREAGLVNCRYTPLTFGIAYIYQGEK